MYIRQRENHAYKCSSRSHPYKCTLVLILHSILQKEIQSKIETQPSLISPASMQKFVTQAIHIAWKLATAVPPLIPSCDEQKFNGKVHDHHFSWDDEAETTNKLKYIRPVLYTNFLGAVKQKGSVTNVKLDRGKSIHMINSLHMHNKTHSELYAHVTI